jgi:hypothetical protein
MKPLPQLACALASAFALFASPIATAESAHPIRVALYNDSGAAGKGVPCVTEILQHTGGYEITIFKAEDLANGVLENKDVVVFTGGSGSKEGTAIGDAGREAVKKFVERGGGYLGICAGAYLACSKFSWGLGLLNAQTVSQKWRRGVGEVQLEFTPAGQHLSTLPAENRPVHYANGPVIKSAGRTDLGPYEPLAFFRTELAENGTPAGAMVNTPAIVQGHFGKGRVVISSPHPEQTPGLEVVVERTIRWLAAGDQP